MIKFNKIKKERGLNADINRFCSPDAAFARGGR